MHKAKEDKPEIPKLTKNTSVPKWNESLRIVLRLAVPVAAPPQRAGEPFSNDTKSVENELIARASHNHPQFSEDDTRLFAVVDEAVRGTIYSSAMSNARRHQDG